MAQQLERLVRVFAAGAVATSAALVAWYGLVLHDWLHGLLAGIALAMAMLPEEFPMAMTIFLALGAWRLARAKVLVRRPVAIDSLGATTLLCLDKTGTLTRNELRLVQVVEPGSGAGREALLETARLASRVDTADPLDRAVFAFEAGSAPSLPPQFVREYPLAPGRPWMAQAWRVGDRLCVAAKGAPEAIARLCRLGPGAESETLAQSAAMAQQGLRIIGVARATGATAGEGLDDEAFEFLGLLGFADPLREDVPAAIRSARQAGIEVAMITGDHAQTALAIARQAGLDTQGGVLLGESLEALDDTALARAARGVRVFARVTPRQKLRIVQAFQAAGHVVAMTGDGVNDAPALKAAHVGIAMGVRGTDVAREAAAVVLLDEAVGHIVEGIALGRRIFDNLRKVMVYIVAIHVPIAGSALLPLLLGLPPLLLPVHVVLAEMVIDPMCSLVFEGAPAEPGLMSRPPRPHDRKLIDPALFALGLAQGGLLLVVVLGVYALALRSGLSLPVARALAILALTSGNVALVAVDAAANLGWRGLVRREFATFWGVSALAGTAIAAGMLVPAARALLQFGQPPWQSIALVLATVGIIAMLLGVARRGAGERPSVV